MGFHNSTITLDKPDCTFHAGEIIHGTLEFNQGKPKNIRGIYVKLKGFAHTHWQTSRSEQRHDGQSREYTINHDGDEQYLSYKMYIIGGESGQTTLNPGNHKFTFQCPIPNNCPSSFEGEYGHIRYKLKIAVDRAYKFDQEREIDIKVISPLDLNEDDYCSNPMELEIEDSYSCWCISSGAVETVVKLPASGFCPGDKIPIQISCDNKSNVDVAKIKLAIKEDTYFIAHYEPGSKSERKTIAEIKKGPVPSRTKRNWTVEMEIPYNMVPSNLNNCKIIDLDYFFKVTVVPSGCHSNTEEKMRLVIGTIPLNNSDDKYEDESNKHQMPQQYHTQTSAYPQNGVFPGANSQYPGANQPFPTTISPYLGSNQPYLGANPSYPGANPSNPGTYPSYPGANQPYPGANQPYPGANQPYPGASPPHSGANLPVPYVNTTPAYPSSIGFQLPALITNPGPFPAPPYPHVMPIPLSNVPGVYGDMGGPGWQPTLPVVSAVSAPTAPEPSNPVTDCKDKVLQPDVSFDSSANHACNPSVVPPDQHDTAEKKI